MNKEQQLIIDVLTACQRGSPLLFDNLGLKVDRKAALEVHCRVYNTSPKVAVVGDDLVYPIITPEQNYLKPEDLSFAEEAYAVLMMALMEAKRKWDRR